MKTDYSKIHKHGEPLGDTYCRGCHSKPSYKNGNTFFCADCWERWNGLRRRAVAIPQDELESFNVVLSDFIESRGRYVWHPEVYLFLRPVPLAELKKHRIEVSSLCRDRRLFAPPDDGPTAVVVDRVRAVVLESLERSAKVPGVREVLKRAKVDHTTLWGCMDYEAFAAEFGGKIPTNVRHRFRDEDAFLNAAASVVRKAQCPMHMTVILEGMGVSYPAYLASFHSVTAEAIHDKAGVPRSREGLASFLEVAGEWALIELGWEVERQASYPDLVGRDGRLLKFDFRLKGVDVLVEIDGPQHFDSRDTYYKESVARGDNLKNDYVMRHGLKLIRVDARIYKDPKAMKDYLRSELDGIRSQRIS